MSVDQSLVRECLNLERLKHPLHPFKEFFHRLVKQQGSRKHPIQAVGFGKGR